MDQLKTDRKRNEYKKQIVKHLVSRNLRAFRETFLELHPADQVELFHEIEVAQQKQVLLFLSPAEFADLFEGLELEDQLTVFQGLSYQYAVSMFNNMSADDVADFLAEIEPERAKDILSSMDMEEAKRVEELMAYAPKTAGAIMTKEFVRLSVESTAKEVIEELRESAPDAETIYYLYVVDKDQRLAGVVSLRDLIIAVPEMTVDEIMSTQVVSVNENEDQEDVARLIQEYDFLAVPVVTPDKRLVGIITVDDVMDVLEEEITEDFGEFTASRGATDLSLTAFTAAKKRAPWLILLMFFGLITANIIGQFEQTLEQVVLLAAFMPMLMGTAGNTGTQSLAVAVRGIATGSFERGGVMKTVKRELGTGIMLGITCMIVLMGIISLFYKGNFLLAFIVGISLFFALSVAAVIGATVPIIINKLKIDPAVASGPFITTMNDIVSLLIYFTVATTLIDKL
ncbi:magnesium transporter [Shouchella clausii]|jgi:magnesium transporter|uniref:Magnesium transporter MgtE n=3 Tax=Shouchella TaxID=2893057 RepID=Q5WK29_SHOC1|nr:MULTISPECIES: magnesium transporter [Shouchella]MCM3314114.1 magnesium transporter [Psychrobacillus sp. MER TA 17]ALA52100.1 Mg/Co/Ni transporter MgtE / CBS domain protein [Shouchella clausii]AST94943.1 magnesium transporter [Shouchella clausii]KKI86950.1 magnesium transporter [Shouchella clausii]MBU3230454.1 magnesium transporter [Shouchella clausii]